MEQESSVIQKIGLASFNDKKQILMVGEAGKTVRNFPGGKVEGDESDEECLARETQEELGTSIVPDSIAYLNTFENEAYGHPGVMVRIRLYTGRLTGEPTPSGEVDSLFYLDSTADPELLSAT